jgi:hypothetical protein
MNQDVDLTIVQRSWKSSAACLCLLVFIWLEEK